MAKGSNAICSPERHNYLSYMRKQKISIRVCQFLILLLAVFIWELAARVGFIDGFLMSQPSRIWKTLMNLNNNNLLRHVCVTFFETIIGFSIGAQLGIFIAFILWWSDFLSKVVAPYLVILNALPKIALGPIIILWVGAGMQAIIVMALAISLVVTVMGMQVGFKNTNPSLIKMVRSLGANKLQTFIKIVFPSNLHTLFSCLKINIGLSLVGVIAGEFLTSSKGLGYLIVYGGQVFQMDLVMTSVIILAMMAVILYGGIVALEQLVMRLISGKVK